MSEWPALSLPAPPQPSEQIEKIRRRRRFEVQQARVGGVLERQAVRVQRLPAKGDRPQRVGAIDVTFLPHEGMAAKPGLDPNLIAPSRVQAHFDERGTGE